MSSTITSLQDDVHNQVIASLQRDADLIELLDSVADTPEGQIFRMWDIDHALKGASIIVDCDDQGETETSVSEDGNHCWKAVLSIGVLVSNVIDPQTLIDHGKHSPHDYFESLCGAVQEWAIRNQFNFLAPTNWALAANQRYRYTGSAGGRTDDGWLMRVHSFDLFFYRQTPNVSTTTTTTTA